MNKTTVWVTNEEIKEGKNKGLYSPTGFHLTEPAEWYTAYRVADPEEFILHMKKYNSLPQGALDRSEYEALCVAHSVQPRNDESLADDYAMKYGDFGMPHYHTDPEGRQSGIESTIHQLRYRAIHAASLRKLAAEPTSTPDYLEGRRLDCGHDVYYRSHVMNASLGTSCPDCYDRMSD